MLDTLRAWIRHRRAPRPPAPPAPFVPPPVSLVADLMAAGLTFESWRARWRDAPATYAGMAVEQLTHLRRVCPREGEAVMAAADRALRHEFDLLGSGPFVPVDPDRPARGAYRPIDWYLDPVRGLRFPRGVPHKEWNLYAMRPGHADVKYPWELARCQHWVSLAQAHLLTGDARYAQEIADELDDFVEANPVGVGINWTCTMDVALRVVSWVVALDLIRRTDVLDDAFWKRAVPALFDHGVFIRGNLENTYEVTSNHFLSNVLGLWFLGALFADLPEGKAWTAFAREALEAEIDVQVLPDGADFESSVPYHRLVAELFLGGARLAEHRGVSLSQHYRGRVEDMIRYLAGVLRPDGLMPQSGDADDGRLHVFAGVGQTLPQDPRHLFGPASVMFRQLDWLRLGGSAALWEAAWWGVASESTNDTAQIPANVRLFPDAGHAVVRDGGLYLLVTNSVVGTKGFGNHKHHDQLGFEYHAGGTPFFVDPGSYVYTSDPEARNLFRSTSYHNTLRIDEVEQHEMNPEWLFRLFEQGRAEHLGFEVDGDLVEYRGRHHGYTRLPDPVVHERRFRLHRTTGRLEIEDRLHGAGRHQARWHWHLAPGVDAGLRGASARLAAAGTTVVLAWPEGLDAALSEAWYSPSYGVRVRCLALDLSARIQAGDSTWRFTISPERAFR